MSIDGSWSVSIETAMGVREARLELHSDGESLTGSMVDPGGPTDVQGRVQGDEIEFVAATPGMSGPVVMTFTGRIEGDGISGGADLGPAGMATWSGTRER